jgi:hypothetical protein
VLSSGAGVVVGGHRVGARRMRKRRCGLAARGLVGRGAKRSAKGAEPILLPRVLGILYLEHG